MRELQLSLLRFKMAAPRRHFGQSRSFPNVGNDRALSLRARRAHDMPSARYILRIRYIASRCDMSRTAERKGKNPPRRIFTFLLYFALGLVLVLKSRAPLTTHPNPSRKREGYFQPFGLFLSAEPMSCECSIFAQLQRFCRYPSNFASANRDLSPTPFP